MGIDIAIVLIPVLEDNVLESAESIPPEIPTTRVSAGFCMVSTYFLIHLQI
jgi:hypothetical protein